jgi:hypothetical protein
MVRRVGKGRFMQVRILPWGIRLGSVAEHGPATALRFAARDCFECVRNSSVSRISGDSRPEHERNIPMGSHSSFTAKFFYALTIGLFFYCKLFNHLPSPRETRNDLKKLTGSDT